VQCQYVLDTDASDTALGAILQQEQDGQLCVIGYASRALTNAERRYCITKKELLGGVYGLKKYRQHLLGREIVVRTDHAALMFLKKMLEPIGQQGRWLDLLSEYIIEIQHRPGCTHSNSDALPRRPCERSGGKECQQCLRTIAGSKAAQARNAEASATGQVQPNDNPRPLTPSNSFWEESYDLPQWFTSDTSTTDTSALSSLPSLLTSSNSIDQVDRLASPVAPASLTLDSSDSDTVTRVYRLSQLHPIHRPSHWSIFASHKLKMIIFCLSFKLCWIRNSRFTPTCDNTQRKLEFYSPNGILWSFRTVLCTGSSTTQTER